MLRIQASTRDEWRAVEFFGCGGVPGCGQVLWRGAGKTSPECHVPASKPTCNHSWGLSLSTSTFPFITFVAADLYGTGLSRDNRVEVISKVDAYFGLPAVGSARMPVWNYGGGKPSRSLSFRSVAMSWPTCTDHVRGFFPKALWARR